MLNILERIVNGQGEEEDLDTLEELGETVREGSLCGLGQTAPNPVLTTIKYFRDEYRTHIVEKRCPAKSCKALIEYYIDEDKCTGCLLCLRSCPTHAVTEHKRQRAKEGEVSESDRAPSRGEGKKKKAKAVCAINTDVCVRCGICFANCPHGAILKRDRQFIPQDIPCASGHTHI